MARTRNVAAHAVRRDEILDAAERQIRLTGYEAMSIQGLQDELGVSRGAIYHYFGSKEDILEAVIDRMTVAGMAVLDPIVADASMRAADKLQAVFATAGAWKAQRSELLLGVLRTWYSPPNDVVRARTQSTVLARFAPLMAVIVRQGVEEGSMNPSAPDSAAVIITSLFAGTADVVFRLLQERLDGRVSFEEVERFMRAYEEAIERILGLPKGSFTLIDDTAMRTWFA